MKFAKFALVAISIMALVMCSSAWYNETDSFNAKVYSVSVQQKVSGNKESFSTDYVYMVSTDKGTFSITPQGIFASESFGSLMNGHTYHLFTRGYKIPMLGIYPYIISATPIEKYNYYEKPY